MKQEITIPQGTEKISIEQFDNRIVIELIPKFEFKDGDVIYTEVDDGFKYIEIFKNSDNDGYYNHVFYLPATMGLYSSDFHTPNSVVKLKRPATEEEKKQLFDKLFKRGKRWNSEKKCIEDLPKQPKIGELCIFWDFACKYSLIRVFKKMEGGRYVDSTGGQWHNCIPFESEDQFIEHIKILN